MDIVDVIAQGQGGQGLSVLGKQFGLNEAQTRAAVEQLAPAVMAGIRRNTGSAERLSGLIGALATGGHDRHLDGNDAAGMAVDGNAILGHVFGSKDVSRGVAAQAAGIAGIDSGILKQMLPMIAAMVMGALARKFTGGQSAGAGGLGGILGQVLGGGSMGPSGAGSLGDILGQVLGGGAASGSGGGLGGMLGGLFGGGQAAPATPTQSGNMGIGDILNSIFGGGASPEVRQAATNRAASVFADALGQGTTSADAADKLLASVTQAVGRR